MTALQIFVTVGCTILAALFGIWISDRTRTKERRHRAIDSIIGIIEDEISRYADFHDAIDESLHRFHFDSCLRISPHIRTLEKLNEKNYEKIKELYDLYDFSPKEDYVYLALVGKEGESPRHILTNRLVALKSELHKL